MISQETRNILQLGLGMFLVFFAFISQGFIVETVIENRSKDVKGLSKNAGYYSQSIIYGTFIISNIIAPPLVMFLTPKWSLVVGSAGYTLYMLGYEFLNPYYLYASAAFEGLFAGVLWTAVGHYMALNSNKNTIGRNSGLVWLEYSLSCVFGGIFLLVMFGNKPNDDITQSQVDIQTRVIYGTFTGVAFIGNVVFALLPADKPKQKCIKIQTKPEKEMECKGYKENISFKDFDTQEESDVGASAGLQLSAYMDELKKSVEMLMTMDMWLLVVVFAYSGIELSYWSGVYSTCLSNTKKFSMNTNKLMAYNSICVGVGEVIGCSVFGFLGHRTNRFGRYPIVLLGCASGIIAYTLSFINLPGNASYDETFNIGYIQPSITIALIVGGLLGLTDACINTQAVLATICMFYGSVLSLGYQLIILTLSALATAVSFTWVELRYRKQLLLNEQVWPETTISVIRDKNSVTDSTQAKS